MRLDFGIVWAHGMPFIDEILSILREYEDLELVMFKKYTPKDFNEFVYKVYELDTVPIAHLISKNKYLKTVGDDVYILLIKNKKPRVEIVGEGEFQHEQCMVINKFKWHVRELFNPVVDGERTEDHVIHCSDYPDQTRLFLEIMDYPGINEWVVPRNEDMPWLPYHMPKYYNTRVKEYDITDLLVGIAYSDRGNKIIPIKETPHYKYVTGDKEEYIKYWDTWKGIKLLEDHSPKKFDGLIEWFNLEKYNGSKEFIVVNDTIVIDGAHRLSILANSGVEKITVIDVKHGN